ncbi:hypothetical protein [Clostridium sp.]
MWEYKTEIFGCSFDTKRSLKQKCDEVLFKCGNAGWELVNFQCADIGSKMLFVFKREKK